MGKKELENLGCRTFCCPQLSYIDESCKELGLSKKVARRARGLSIDYLKKTYQTPVYTGARPVLTGAICIASILESEYVTPREMYHKIKYASDVHKWVKIIVEELGIEMVFEGYRGNFIKFKYGDETGIVPFNKNAVPRNGKVDIYRSIYSLGVVKDK